MAAKKRSAEGPEQSSRAAGACVLVILGGVVMAAVFAVSADAGVLAVWVVGAVALWRAARRRVSDSSATPPPRGVASESDETARRRLAKARGATDPSGVMCIYHEPHAEEVSNDDPTPPRRPRLRVLRRMRMVD